MIVVFTEDEKTKKARYQRGSVELHAGQTIQIDSLGIMVTNFSKKTKHVVASNTKLSSAMIVNIPLDDEDGENGPTGLLN